MIFGLMVFSCVYCCVLNCYRINFGPAKNHRTLVCTPPLDAQEPLTRGIPDTCILSRGIPRSRAPLAEPKGMVSISAQGFLGSEIPRLRNSSTENFRHTHTHPVAELGQVWPFDILKRLQNPATLRSLPHLM